MQKPLFGAAPTTLVFSVLGQNLDPPSAPGHRTNGKFGEYEWWYLDGRMDDGSALVIVYYSQPVTAAIPIYAPSVTFSVTHGDKHIQDSVTAKIKDSAFDRHRLP